MNISRFVCGTALLLIAWLTVTFIHDVPAKAYATPATVAAPGKSAVEILPASISH